MGRISLLASHVANLIAAGEVVERPASIVKELVENSIDAGANSITVEVKGSGISFVRVTDNGAGIAPEDMETAFMRHATSKISQRQDLEKIETLGFRGEALAAVGAVAKVDMFSKQKGSVVGHHLLFEGGKPISSDVTGCPEGTTVVVRDIFYNTPARAKFLKKDATELAHIASSVEWLALSSPTVAFTFIKDGQIVLNTPGNGDIKNTVYSVLGKDSFKRMTPVSYKLDGIKVSGYTSKPLFVRANRSMQYFFLNGRFVRARIFTVALEDAYKDKLMTGRYPCAVLYITMDPRQSDINVHPAKLEVKLQNERRVHNAIYFGVKSAIEKGDSPPKIKIESSASKQEQQDTKPDSTIFTGNLNKSYNINDSKSETKLSQQVLDMYNTPLSIPAVNVSGDYVKQDKKETVQQVEKPEVQNRLPAIQEVREEKEKTIQNIPPRLIGELFSTYIVVQQGDEVFLIDKHAAHERLIYERLIAGYYKNYQQVLLSPVVVNLSPVDKDTVLRNNDIFKEAGFNISEFGGDSIIVREVPSDLEQEDIAALIGELASQLEEGHHKIISQKRERTFKTIACKAAIKANQFTGNEELEHLVKTLFSITDIRYCPHGRPVAIILTKNELEKQFGRLGSPPVSNRRE